MANADLHLGFLTSSSFSSKDAGRRVLALVQELLPEAMPGRYGNFQPFRSMFEEGGMEKALESWAHPFLWTRPRPKVSGDFRFGRGRRHYTHHLFLNSVQWNMSSIIRYLREMSILLRVDLAYLHVYCAEELHMADRYSRIHPFRRGLFTTDLLSGIPDLCSIMVFGPPYVHLFGREKITSAPAKLVTELGDDLIEIEVLDDPAEIGSDFVAFESQRGKIKQHLGVSAFVQGEENQSAVVPSFSFAWRRSGASNRVG